jgi:hypothetical protein
VIQADLDVYHGGEIEQTTEIVAEMGGAGNVARIRAALPEAMRRRGIDGRTVDLLFLPTAEEHRARLEAHGFAVRTIALFARPTPLPGDRSAVQTSSMRRGRSAGGRARKNDCAQVSSLA